MFISALTLYNPDRTRPWLPAKQSPVRLPHCNRPLTAEELAPNKRPLRADGAHGSHHRPVASGGNY
jgi:hypothetical protein